MTMPTDAASPPRASYIENGVTVSHPIPFKFIAPSHISVVRTLADGTKQTLTQGVHYTVQGGAFNVGTITKANGGIAGASIEIDRNTPRDQQLDYAQGDGFPAESHEQGLDRLTMISQELARDQINRSNLLERLLEVITGGGGITLEVVNGKLVIISDLDAAGDLADMLQLSGDQQAGGTSGTGAGSLNETIRDVVATALEGIDGISVTQDDGADKIRIGIAPGGAFQDLSAAEQLSIVASSLVPGSGVSLQVVGGKVEIAMSGLDASFRGLVPRTVNDADFNLEASDWGRAVRAVPSTQVRTLTIRAESVHALPAGYATVIRNTGTQNLNIALAGVLLFKNGSTSSASATLAPGGVAQIHRWAADEFTINGTKVS